MQSAGIHAILVGETLMKSPDIGAKVDELLLPDALVSNWTITQIVDALSDVERIDDEGDLLACRVAGSQKSRTAYIYLYGDDPNLIHYDLEDESIETRRWDHAVESGSVTDLTELRHVVLTWLQ